MYAYALPALALLAFLSLAYALRARSRVRTLAAEQQRASERFAAILDAAGHFMSASGDSAASVLQALEDAVRRFEPEIDAVLVFVPEAGELRCAAAAGACARALSAPLNDECDALPSRAARERRVCVLGDSGALFPTDRAALAVPLVVNGVIAAVVYCASLARMRDARLLSAIVAQAAIPLAVAMAGDAHRRNAVYDALTGLLSPRAFRERLKAEVAACGRQGTIALWFIDTDHFKAVNDTLGHAAGDTVLRAIAAMLRAAMREEVDIAARNGGDEFCAIVKNAGKIEAIARAAEFCANMRAFDFGAGLRLTASIGVACYPADARSASELLEAADAAMYFSKRSGRNRVAFASAPGTYAIYE